MDKTDLKQAGLKITRPRLKILELLETASQRHFTAESIYQILIKEDSGIGLATVYRVLTQFEAAGLVVRHHFEGAQSIFELNHGEHHDHIVDVKTGKIIEFHDDLIEQRQIEVAKDAGYRMVDHSLTLYCEKIDSDEG